MAMAALSPASVLATPAQVNPQVQTDLQNSQPQVAQDALRLVKAIQTDTVTISAQALKMAADEDNDAREAKDIEADEALSGASKREPVKNDAEKKEYSLVSYRA